MEWGLKGGDTICHQVFTLTILWSKQAAIWYSVISYTPRIKRKSNKIWTNFEQDVDKNWAKSTLNFDIFYIRLLRLCEVKKDLNCLISHVLKHLFYKGLHIYICQNQMGYHEMGIFVALYLIFVRVHQFKQKLDQWFCWNNYIIISKGKLMLCVVSITN